MSRDSMGSMANMLNNYATILSTYIENICVIFKFYFIIIEKIWYLDFSHYGVTFDTTMAQSCINSKSKVIETRFMVWRYV